MKKYKLIFVLLPFLFFSSCINEEGEGGTAVVDGYIHKVIHPDGTYKLKADTVVGARTNVFIMYGDKKPYGDKMDTGADGYFRFEYLTKGDYTIFAYNKYPDGSEEAVYEKVTVKRGQTATIKDIYIHEGKMFGKSYIKGVILADYYDKNTIVKANVPAVESRVYIKEKGAPVPFNDVRAGSDGTFMFEKLSVGEYIIYASSEDSDRIISVENEIEVVVDKEGVIVEVEEPIKIKCRS